MRSPAIRRLALLVACVLAGGCGVHSEHHHDHASHHSHYASTLVLDDDVTHLHLRLELDNLGPYDDWFETVGGRAHRFVVYDEWGDAVWDSFLHEPPSAVDEIWELRAGATLISDSVWYLTDDFGVPLPAGQYTVVPTWYGTLHHDGAPPVAAAVDFYILPGGSI